MLAPRLSVLPISPCLRRGDPHLPSAGTPPTFGRGPQLTYAGRGPHQGFLGSAHFTETALRPLVQRANLPARKGSTRERKTAHTRSDKPGTAPLGDDSVRAEGTRRLFAVQTEPLRQVDAWLEQFRGFPVGGDLKLGGHNQREGNAGGEILRWEPPQLLKVSWLFGDSVRTPVSARSSCGRRPRTTGSGPRSNGTTRRQWCAARQASAHRSAKP